MPAKNSPAFAPYPKPKTIALIGKFKSTETAETVAQFADELNKRGICVLLEAQTASVGKSIANVEICDFYTIGERADLAIVIGGDGTMLNVARQLAWQQIPLVGVNQGRLGFMTDINKNTMIEALNALLAGLFTLEKRLLLQAEIWRDGACFATHLAVNEAVVEKGASARLIEFEVFIEREFVYNLRADGLIVSTPTGSTAYSLSANGAILHPQMAAIALVPLCPHSLTNRPLIIGEHSNIEIGIVRAQESRIHFDGQKTFDLKEGDLVRVARAENVLRLLHPPGYSYFSTLRKKLHWTEQIEAAAIAP